MRREPLVLSLIPTACGGDVGDGGDSAGTGTFNSGLPPGTELEDLTQGQAEHLADSVVDYVRSEAFVRASCKASGFATAAGMEGSSDAVLQDACAEEYAECLATPLEPIDTTDTSALAGCTATVGEYEACLTANLALMEHMLAQIPECSSITADSVQLAGGALDFDGWELPLECEVVAGKCPTLMGR